MRKRGKVKIVLTVFIIVLFSCTAVIGNSRTGVIENVMAKNAADVDILTIKSRVFTGEEIIKAWLDTDTLDENCLTVLAQRGTAAVTTTYDTGKQKITVNWNQGAFNGAIVRINGREEKTREEWTARWLKTFENLGISVDDSYEKIQEISDKVSYAMKADVTDKDALQALGARNLDGVVVAVSEHPEANIMATLLCKEMGIPLVVAKAKDKLQGTILEKVGADSVVYPEIEMGSRIAKNMVANEFTDWIELSNDYSIVEIAVPRRWEGKNLAELDVRKKYGITVVGVMQGEKMDISFNPQTPLPGNAILVLIGANKILEKIKIEEE